MYLRQAQRSFGLSGLRMTGIPWEIIYYEGGLNKEDA
jgi:hypothetical protein